MNKSSEQVLKEWAIKEGEWAIARRSSEIVHLIRKSIAK